MELAVTFVLGVIFGSILVYTISRANNVGNIRIDRSDPDGPYLFLELKEGVDRLSKRRYAMCRIVDKNYVSHK